MNVIGPVAVLEADDRATAHALAMREGFLIVAGWSMTSMIS